MQGLPGFGKPLSRFPARTNIGLRTFAGTPSNIGHTGTSYPMGYLQLVPS